MTTEIASSPIRVARAALPLFTMAVLAPLVASVAVEREPTAALRIVDVSGHGDAVGVFCARDDGRASGDASRSYAPCERAWRARCDGRVDGRVEMPAPEDGDERVLTFVIDGDLVMDSASTLEFELTGLAGRDVNLVVRGDVFIADDLVAHGGRVRVYAVRDPRSGAGGDIVLGDHRFGTLDVVEADLIASGRILRLSHAENASRGHVALEGVPLTID